MAVILMMDFRHTEGRTRTIERIDVVLCNAKSDFEVKRGMVIDYNERHRVQAVSILAKGTAKELRDLEWEVGAL